MASPAVCSASRTKACSRVVDGMKASKVIMPAVEPSSYLAERDDARFREGPPATDRPDVRVRS